MRARQVGQAPSDGCLAVFAAAIGRKGQGPQEVEQLLQFHFLGDRVYLVSPGSVAFFDRGGKLCRQGRGVRALSPAGCRPKGLFFSSLRQEYAFFIQSLSGFINTGERRGRSAKPGPSQVDLESLFRFSAGLAAVARKILTPTEKKRRAAMDRNPAAKNQGPGSLDRRSGPASPAGIGKTGKPRPRPKAPEGREIRVKRRPRSAPSRRPGVVLRPDPTVSTGGV